MRGQGRSLVKYRRNRIPRHLLYGRKVLADIGGNSYEDRLCRDDFGNTYDPRKHTGDVDYGGITGRQA